MRRKTNKTLVWIMAAGLIMTANANVPKVFAEEGDTIEYLEETITQSEENESADVSEEAGYSINQESEVEEADIAEASGKLENAENVPEDTEIVAEDILPQPIEVELNADQATSDGFEYTVSNGKATITAYMGSATNVTIPSSIGGYTVTAIQDEAFKDNVKLKTVKIPSTVTAIGDLWGMGVFSGCKNLTTVTIEPGSEDSFIGSGTFDSCFSLTEISIPGNYLYIGAFAFEDCISLKQMVYSDNSDKKQIIYGTAFKNCNSLSYVSLPSSLQAIEHSAFANCAIKNLEIPEGVVSIGAGAFANNKNLETVTISSTVTSLGGSNYDNYDGGVFADCDSLMNVIIKEGEDDSYIGWNTFQNCTSLSEIIIPGNYLNISPYAFENCINMKKVTYKENRNASKKQTVGEYAFANCSNLETIILSSSIQDIGAYAFKECIVEDLTIPEGIVSIGKGSFMNCKKIRTVSIPSTITKLGDDIFSGCENLSGVTLIAGEDDAYIGASAFENCKSLGIIIIPNNYETIGKNAFKGCSNLKTLYWAGSKKVYMNQTIEANFLDCTSLTYLYLPETVSAIGKFGYTKKMTIYGKTGSYAQTYANENGIPFRNAYVDPYIQVTDVKLNQSSATILKGNTLTLSATVSANNATNKALEWTSSNPAVATVDGNGKVTAVGIGNATIVCAAAEGSGKQASCAVTVNRATAYTQTEAFAARLYEKCLGREPEEAGLEYWNRVLVSKERSGAQVAQGFVFSQEYQQKKTSDAEYVEMLYNVFLDRASDEGGKAYWLEQLSNGVSREYVFRGFAESQEFTNICNSYNIERGSVTLSQARDKNPKLTAYVNRMYTKALNRAGEEEGLNYWCNFLQTGERTPEQVAESFINSKEFRLKNLNDEEYIKVLYRAFMGREYDQAGLEYWKNELNHGSTREEVLHKFAISREFKNIQSSFGL